MADFARKPVAPERVQAIQVTADLGQDEDPPWFDELVEAGLVYPTGGSGSAWMVSTGVGIRRALPTEFIVQRADGTLTIYGEQYFLTNFEPVE